jgi:hypothetical protein
MKAAGLAIVLAAALVAAPISSAKGGAPDRICGESACVPIEDYPHVMVVLYAGAARSQPPTLPFYRIHYPAPGVPPHTFVPARNLVGAEYSGGRRWFNLDQPALGAIWAAIRGLEPFPAPDSWATTSSRAQDENRMRSLGAAVLLIALAGAAVAARRSGNPSASTGVGAA